LTDSGTMYFEALHWVIRAILSPYRLDKEHVAIIIGRLVAALFHLHPDYY
jgi:hypothetical protein